MAIKRWSVWACVWLLAFAAGCKLCRPCDDGASHERAGHPNEVAPWAHPSDTGRYVGYEVGGGAAHARHAEPPSPDDGTWGWDYHGSCLPSRVVLGWWHGRKPQGGTGAYNSDGPRPLHAIESRHERRGD
jgi:hypothetical protein